MSGELWIETDNGPRRLGNILPDGGPRYKWPVYGEDVGTVDKCPMYPRAEWSKYCVPEAELSPFLPPVHDQDGIGMCNASATAAAVEYTRAVQGLEYVALSGGHLYGRINGGSDSGSLLEDGLAESMRRGIASVAKCDYLNWRRRTAEADADGLNYVVLEAYLCPTFDHVMSAAIARFGIISGIMWASNYRPDADGWLPEGGGGGGGHAVFGYAPAMRNGRYGVWHQNSWGNWGPRQGRCVFPESVYRGPVGGWWAVRAVTVKGQGDIPAPKFLN